jgi:NADPH:quinone reductase
LSADAGKLRPQVETTFPLEQARHALAHVAAGHTRGKIVLQIEH